MEAPDSDRANPALIPIHTAYLWGGWISLKTREYSFAIFGPYHVKVGKPLKWPAAYPGQHWPFAFRNLMP